MIAICIKKRIRRILYAVFLAVCILAIYLCFKPKTNKTSAYAVQNNDDRISFMEKFGYKPISEPDEIKYIVVPDKDDSVYASYNKLQTQQGFDLEKYAGREAKLYVYKIAEYDDLDNVYANLIVCDDCIIACDISKRGENGFTKALVK